jgi:hypothetical protein
MQSPKRIMQLPATRLPSIRIGPIGLGILLAVAARAQVAPTGSEIQVAATATFQSAPAVAADPIGDFVAVWQELAANGSWNIFARQYGKTGVAVGPELQVNSTTSPGCRQLPAVAADAVGNFIVVWASDEESGSLSGIFGQLFNSAGQRIGSQFQVNTTTAFNDQAPAVAMAPDGRFLVAWQADGQDASSWGIYARAYQTGGTSPSAEIAVNQTTAGAQHSPAVAFLAGAGSSGGYALTWQSESQDGTGAGASGVVARILDASGSGLTGELAVNATMTGSHGHPHIASDPSGNFAVAWENLTGAGSAVLVRRFTAAGNPISPSLAVDAAATGPQRNPAVAADTLGNIVVVWDTPGQDGDGTAVLAEQLNNQQQILGAGKVQLNTTTPGDQERAAVAMSSGGDVWTAWQSVTPAADGAVVTARLALVPGLRFYTLPPCRVVDTRNPNGPLGGPALVSGQSRNFVLTLPAALCGVPATASALAVNVTVVTPTGSGYLELYPGDAPAPPTSTISFIAHRSAIANNSVISLSRNGDGSLSVTAFISGSPGQTHFLLDVSGYFQ